MAQCAFNWYLQSSAYTSAKERTMFRFRDTSRPARFACRAETIFGFVSRAFSASHYRRLLGTDQSARGDSNVRDGRETLSDV